MFKNFAQQALALELLKRHARISIVHRETGIPKQVLREAYRELHGRSPSPGALKYSTQGLARNLRKRKAVTLFAVCFQTVEYQSRAGHIQKVIIAFDIYKMFCPDSPLDFSEAWVVARDLMAKQIEVVRCPYCGSAVLINGRDGSRERCAVCNKAIES
jgi:hypothetical protein